MHHGRLCVYIYYGMYIVAQDVSGAGGTNHGTCDISVASVGIGQSAQISALIITRSPIRGDCGILLHVMTGKVTNYAFEML